MFTLFTHEGLTIGALLHRRVVLMCPYRDAVERTIVFVLAVIGTLGHGTADRFIRGSMVSNHLDGLLCFWGVFIMRQTIWIM